MITGTFGFVVQSQDDSRVAVKTYKDSCLHEFPGHALAEAMMGLHLEHPHLISFHSLQFDKHQIQVRMPWRQSLEPHALPLSSVLRVLVQVANTVQSLHEAHLLHLDIKPDNLVCDAAGNAQLIDLGMMAPDQCIHWDFFGTSGFEIPNRREHEPLGRADDVYALLTTALQVLWQHFAGPSVDFVSVKDAVSKMDRRGKPSLASLMQQIEDWRSNYHDKSAGAFAALLWRHVPGLEQMAISPPVKFRAFTTTNNDNEKKNKNNHNVLQDILNVPPTSIDAFHCQLARVCRDNDNAVLQYLSHLVLEMPLQPVPMTTYLAALMYQAEHSKMPAPEIARRLSLHGIRPTLAKRLAPRIRYNAMARLGVELKRLLKCRIKSVGQSLQVARAQPHLVSTPPVSATVRFSMWRVPGNDVKEVECWTDAEWTQFQHLVVEHRNMYCDRTVWPCHFGDGSENKSKFLDDETARQLCKDKVSTMTVTEQYLQMILLKTTWVVLAVAHLPHSCDPAQPTNRLLGLALLCLDRSAEQKTVEVGLYCVPSEAQFGLHFTPFKKPRRLSVEFFHRCEEMMKDLAVKFLRVTPTPMSEQFWLRRGFRDGVKRLE